jgi:carboxylesterase
VKALDAIEAALVGIDRAFGRSLDALANAGLLESSADLTYAGIRKSLFSLFSRQNDLVIIGAENVPKKGGVVLAANHQSWLDPLLLLASSPRRVRFVAKEGFRETPILRTFIRFSGSVYVGEKGTRRVLDNLVKRLKKGRAVGIFPEGAVPGGVGTPRHRRDPETGLLPGRTGAIRIALRAKVPIIPVGISGAERVLPPEVIPRAEIIRIPPGTPITIRFGEPFTLDGHNYKSIDHDTLRLLTEEMMRRISALVDHRSNFVPAVIHPLKRTTERRLGVLVLHGFTSHPESVSAIVPQLEAAGLPYAVPVLRGHGTRFEDLCGVTPRHWYIDAEHALVQLAEQVDKVVVVGFSMGGLLALELAMRHPFQIAGVVTLAACLKFSDPLARFAGRFSTAVKYWDSPNSFSNPEVAPETKSYDKFPLETFARLYEYSQHITARLEEVHVPIRILQSKKDTVVMPVSANILMEKVSSPRREIVWYKKSGHSLLMDVESEKVMRDVMRFVQSLV